MSNIPSQQEVDDELHECARYGELDILQEMKASDDTNMLNFNALDSSGNCALHKAAANNHIEMLRYLKQNGAKYLLNTSQVGPITWAILNKHFEATKWFLEEYSDDVDVLLKPEFGLSPLSTAYDLELPTVVEMLLKHNSSAALESGEYGQEVFDDEDDERALEEEQTATTPLTPDEQAQ